MKATLMRVTPDAKVFVGEGLCYPEPGGSFVMIYNGDNGPRYLRTSLIISLTVLADGTTEFNTLNSTYRLYEVDNALRN